MQSIDRYEVPVPSVHHLYMYSYHVIQLFGETAGKTSFHFFTINGVFQVQYTTFINITPNVDKTVDTLGLWVLPSKTANETLNFINFYLKIPKSNVVILKSLRPACHTPKARACKNNCALFSQGTVPMITKWQCQQQKFDITNISGIRAVWQLALCFTHTWPMQGRANGMVPVDASLCLTWELSGINAILVLQRRQNEARTASKLLAW